MSTFNPIHLAQAIVHWLEYQNICGRSELFCEAYLAQPIGEYGLSLKPEHFEPDLPYPDEYQKGMRRRRSLDFAIFKKDAGAAQKFISDAIETKYITTSRDFTQEIFDDLFRLLWFQPTREPARCQRWLVLAGVRSNIEGEDLLAGNVQLGRGANQPQAPAFTGLLSMDLHNHTRTKPVHGGVPQLRACWVKAAKNFGQKQLPDTITVRLAGRAFATRKPTDVCCYIWEIKRPQPDFAGIYPC